MQKRSLALDAMKLLACVGVVVIHLSGYGLELFPIGSFSWLSSAFWDSLARFAVPVFFMCTGALMLPPARRLKTSAVPVTPGVVPGFTGTALVRRGAVEWGCTAGRVAGTRAMEFWKAKLC